MPKNVIITKDYIHIVFIPIQCQLIPLVDTHTGTRLDTRPYTRPSTRSGTRPNNKTVREQLEPSTRPGTVPGTRPGTRPRTKPGTRSRTRPGTRMGAIRPRQVHLSDRGRGLAAWQAGYSLAITASRVNTFKWGGGRCEATPDGTRSLTARPGL